MKKVCTLTECICDYSFSERLVAVSESVERVLNLLNDTTVNTSDCRYTLSQEKHEYFEKEGIAHFYIKEVELL